MTKSTYTALSHSSYQRDHCPSTFGLIKCSNSPAFFESSKSGLGSSKNPVVLPYVIPPKRLIGFRIAGSIAFLSSLIASSLAQNRVPSMIARTPVFFPGVALLSNSFVSISLPSIEKIASLTREAFTVVHGAGCNPDIAHSEMPYGAFIEVELAASTKCSEMTLITHSFVSMRFFRLSLAFS